MTTKQRMPALFIGHGSPMNAVSDNAFTQSLKELSGQIPQPKAIMVLSAHWLTRGTFVTCQDKPRQIYDFSGFPDELYRINYQPPGAAQLAEKVAAQLPDTVRCNTTWGLDHASWAVLLHMYPHADIPVFEMSINMPEESQYHYDLGRQLAFLRDEGVLVIGSGNIVHNMGLMRTKIEEKPYRWVIEFDAYVADCLLKGNHQGLINYKEAGLAAQIAVQTSDHYLPLLYVVALQEAGEKVQFFHEGINHASISMRSLIIS